MRRLAEIAAFLGLSAAVHAGVMAGFGDRPGGPQGQGAAGADRVSLQAAPESLAALAERWTTPPDVGSTPVSLASPTLPDTAPDLSSDSALPRAIPQTAPQTALPDSTPMISLPAPTLSRPSLAPPPTAPSAPQTDTIPMSDARSDTPTIPRAPQRLPTPETSDAAAPDTTTPPPPDATDLATASSPRPSVRPSDLPQRDTAPVRQVAPQSAPQPARVADGAGAGATQGAAAAPSAPSLNAAQRQSLMAGWGAQIMARIERARPRVRGTGQVTLALQVARNGQLAALSVAQSSGDPSLDDAALSAVRRAGSFPPAPDGLTEASYAFSLPIRFR